MAFRLRSSFSSRSTVSSLASRADISSWRVRSWSFSLLRSACTVK
jgi:hypothetical protein